MPRQITFNELSRVNLERVRLWHPCFQTKDDKWSGSDWSNAAAGEMGETCNIVKKLRRRDLGIRGRNDPTNFELRLMLRKEIGDTIVYLDLLAQYYNITLEDCVTLAFNQVSEREGFEQRLVR